MRQARLVEHGTHDRSVPNDAGLKVIELKVKHCTPSIWYRIECFYDAEKGYAIARQTKAGCRDQSAPQVDMHISEKRGWFYVTRGVEIVYNSKHFKNS